MVQLFRIFNLSINIKAKVHSLTRMSREVLETIMRLYTYFVWRFLLARRPCPLSLTHYRWYAEEITRGGEEGASLNIK